MVRVCRSCGLDGFGGNLVKIAILVDVDGLVNIKGLRCFIGLGRIALNLWLLCNGLQSMILLS